MSSLDEEQKEILRTLSQTDLDEILLSYITIRERSGNPALFNDLTRRIRREQQWSVSRWINENVMPIVIVVSIFLLSSLIMFTVIHDGRTIKRNIRIESIRDELIEYGYAEYVRTGNGEKQWRIVKPK